MRANHPAVAARTGRPVRSLGGTAVFAVVLAACATVQAQPIEQDHSEALKATHSLSRELWRESVAAPQWQADYSALKTAVQDVGEMKFIRRRAHEVLVRQTPEVVVEEVATAQPELSPEALEQLKQLKDVPNPAALADALFLAGRLEAAGVFYEAALERGSSGDDHAWQLFQLANCRRRFSPAEAKDTYRRVIEQHPESPWAPLAQAHEQVIAWSQEYQPLAVLKSVATKAQKK